MMVTKLPVLQVDHDGICRGCGLGKNTMGSFSSSESRSKGILDLVHFDLCGSMTFVSLGGYYYYVILIDDYPWKTWIYFLKSIEYEEVLCRFKEFKEQVENLSGIRIKVMRLDNGGEYTSTDFSDLSKEIEIKREYTVPYNPQQKRVA